ncbi:MAG: hypothetical protein AAGF72_14610 [Pseudomonadota bacterium]
MPAGSFPVGIRRAYLGEAIEQRAEGIGRDGLLFFAYPGEHGLQQPRFPLPE